MKKFIGAGKSKPRKGVKTLERNAITAIVRNPKNMKYLALRLRDIDWEAFITGGIEEGQTAEEAALMEVREEVGYINLKLISRLPSYDALLYHMTKKVNRLAHFQCFLFELLDEEMIEISNEEKERHEAVWLTKEELKTFNLPEGHRYIFEKI